METYTIPYTIKRKILFDNLFSIIIGIGLIAGTVSLKFFVIEKYIDDTTIQNIFNVCMCGITFIGTIFLIVLPAVALISGTSEKKTEKFMRKNQITTEMLSEDFTKAKTFGKVKIGHFFTYFKANFEYNIIPNKDILWVYKRTKAYKQKRVNRSLNGDIKNERYLMSERYTYSVILRLYTGKKYTVSCSGKKSAEDIIKYYEYFSHILLGEDRENKRQYEKKRKEILEKIKENNMKKE